MDHLRNRITWGALAALLALAASCSDAPDQAPPNVLLISIDTLRADHLACYGYGRETSPRLDRLAAEGVRVERCVAPTSWTLPSHVSMLTGNPISVHGIDDDRRWEIQGPEGEPVAPVLHGKFLSETLAAEGYRSAGFFTWKYLDARYGFGPGFESWERLGHTFYSHPVVGAEYRKLTEAGDVEGLKALLAKHPILFDSAHNSSPEVVDRTTKWLSEHAERGDGQPFFLFAHFFDVHDPYVTPEPYHSMFDPDYEGPIDGMRITSPDSPVHAGMDPRDLHNLVARYDGGIRYVDDHVGQVLDHLDSLGLTETTLVIVTSDHGEEFFEHGKKTHRQQLYPESIQVPLILRWPAGIPAGRVLRGTAGLVDIAPTVAHAAGADFGHPLGGRSLLPLPLDDVLEQRSYLSELLLFDQGPVPLRQFALSEAAQRASIGRARGPEPWALEPVPDDRAAFEDRLGELLDQLRQVRAGLPTRTLGAGPRTAAELDELAAGGYSGDDETASVEVPGDEERLSVEGGVWPDR